MKRFTSFLLGLLGTVTIVSCEKEFTVEPTEVKLFAETTSQLKVTGSNITYTSLDDYYARVSDDGLITGKKVGETSIIVSSGDKSQEVKVTVRPAFEFLPDVAALLEKSKSDVTAIFGEDYTEIGQWIEYKNWNTYTSSFAFCFTDGKVSRIGVHVNAEYKDQFLRYLQERYYDMGGVNGKNRFANHSKDFIEYEWRNVSLGYCYYAALAIPIP
ncbi:MAG: Ig-like domain-containing protein [Bacteroidales bacterium]|nr:Ig-like domain-containing protein [Bacteroidales bacterium]